MTSYASRNQLAVSQASVDAAAELEAREGGRLGGRGARRGGRDSPTCTQTTRTRPKPRPLALTTIVSQWDRTYVAVLGVAGGRKYEMRLQVASQDYDAKRDAIQQVAQSFRCKEVVT